MGRNTRSSYSCARCYKRKKKVGAFSWIKQMCHALNSYSVCSVIVVTPLVRIAQVQRRNVSGWIEVLMLNYLEGMCQAIR